MEAVRKKATPVVQPPETVVVTMTLADAIAIRRHLYTKIPSGWLYGDTFGKFVGCPALLDLSHTLASVIHPQ